MSAPGSTHTGPPTASLLRSDLTERVTELLVWVWTEAVRRYRAAPLLADHGGRYRCANHGSTVASAALPRRWTICAPGMPVRLGKGHLQYSTRATTPPRQICRGSVAFRPGHSRPRLGVVGRAAPVRRDVPVLGRTGQAVPPVRGAGRAARASATGRRLVLRKPRKARRSWWR